MKLKPQPPTSIILFLAVIGLVLIVALKNNPKSQNQKDCPTVQKQNQTVRGHSLEPLINPGDPVKIYFGYYGCNKIKRDDIIAYNYAGQKDPIIKIIKALPGDELKLIKSEESNCWGIQVNNEILATSKNQPYCLPDANSKMLALYQGQIQENTYLLLGNLAQGSLDSTRFGLVNQTDILGKVVW